MVFLLIGGLALPVLSAPASAEDPLEWIEFGNSFGYTVDFSRNEGPPETMTYDVAITQATQTVVAYHETYSMPNGTGEEIVEYDTAFNVVTREVIEPAWFGEYSTWLYVQQGDMLTGYAYLAGSLHTYVGVSLGTYRFEAWDASGNYSYMEYSMAEQRLLRGHGTVVWGNESATFQLDETPGGGGGGSGSAMATGGVAPVSQTRSKSLPRRASLGVGGPRPLHTLVYAFAPPYNSDWDAGNRYNQNGCWDAYYEPHYSYYYTGVMHGRSGAFACPPPWWTWYSRVFSWTYEGMNGPSGGKWRATATETLEARFGYYMDVYGLTFVSVPWWGGAAGAKSKVTLLSEIREYSTGYTVTTESWVIYDLPSYGYVDWSGYVTRYQYPNLVNGRDYYFRMNLDTDTRAVVVGFGAATAAADVWATSQYVNLYRY